MKLYFKRVCLEDRVEALILCCVIKEAHESMIKDRCRRGMGKKQKTYNTRDSLVVTDPTTSLALTGLSMGERTGSRILQWVWSYVEDGCLFSDDMLCVR